MPDLIDKDQLSKLLAMLASDNANERAVAGMKASELVKKSGQSWNQILASGGKGIVVERVVERVVEKKIYVPTKAKITEIDMEWYEYVAAFFVWAYLMLVGSTLGFIISVFASKGYYPYIFAVLWLFSVIKYWQLKRTITVANNAP